MISIKHAVAIIIICIVPIYSQAQETTIDFEGFLEFTTIHDQYVPQGVQVSIDNYAQQVEGPFILNESGSQSGFLCGNIFTGQPVGGSFCRADLSVRFVSPGDVSTLVTVNNVRFRGEGFNHFEAWTVFWLDKDGAVIASQKNQNFLGHDGDCRVTGDPTDTFETFFAPGPIGGFFIQNNSFGLPCTAGGDGYNIDDIVFEPFDPTDQERRDLDCPPEGVGFGNPCDAATGNKYQREVDYLPGPGVGLPIIRHYSSQSSLDVGFGVGWTSSYHKRLTINAGVIRAFKGTGSSEGFLNISSVWTGPADGDLELTEDATGYTITYPDGDFDRFDLTGKLLQENRRGKITTFAYDLSGRLSTVTGPFGHALTFQYDLSNHIERITDPAGNDYLYGYDGSGNPVFVTYPDLTSKTYHYENATYPFALTGITNEKGVRFATFGYDALGRANSTEHATTDNGGPQEKFTLTFDSETQTAVVDPRGTVNVLTFDENLNSKNLINSLNQTDGKSLAQEFDTDNNQTRFTDGEGRITQRFYNNSNQLTQIREGYLTPDEQFTTFVYESSTLDLVSKVRTLSVDGASFYDRNMTYDANLNIDTVTENGFDADTNPISRTTDFDFDNQGRLILIDGPRTAVSDVSQFSYYSCVSGSECGQLQSVTNALGHVVDFQAYDSHGRVTQVTDANGLTAQFVYDLRGRLASTTETPPVGPSRIAAFTYTPTGQIETSTSPEGITVTYTYDDAEYLRVIEDTLGNEIRRDYDLAGNVINETVHDPLGILRKQQQSGYDARGFLGSLTELNNATVFVNDSQGNREMITDANLNSQTNQFDALNRIIASTDALTGVTQYQYDIANRLELVQGPNGATTSYVYNDLGELLQELSPDRGTIQHSYDGAGNRISTTDANGVVANYAYDSLNRLTSVTYPSDSTADVTYTYDETALGQNGIGRLTRATTASTETRYFYDSHGNLVQQSIDASGVTLDTLYTYDLDDRILSVTYPSGRIVQYNRDVVGRINSVQSQSDPTATSITLASAAAYEPFGPLSGLTYGNGEVLTISYDEAYRADAIQTTSGGADTQNLLYGRDAVGNILSWQDKLDQSKSQTLSYDSLDRLDTAQSSYGAFDFDYDPNSNRTNQLLDSNNTTYAYTAMSNRLIQIDNGTDIWDLVYDDNGNLTSKLDAGDEGWIYEYDLYNRLETVLSRRLVPRNKGNGPPKLKNIVVGTYTYDAFGQRVTSVVDSDTTIFVYGLDGEVLAEADPQLTKFRDYIYLDNRPIAVQDLEVVSTNPPPEEVIVDNGDLGTSTAGTWSTLSSKKDFGANYLLANGGTGSTHTWVPALTPGDFEVYAWWVSKKQYSESVPYTITHSGQQTTVTVDQSANGGKWNLLGTFAFDGSGTESIQVTDGAKKTTADAVRFVKVLTPSIELVDDTHFVHADHLATPRAITDDTGTVMWSWFSAPFGGSLANEDPDADGNDYIFNLRFPGQYYHVESELHYNYYRTYDPSTGRYLESDPIGLNGGLNTYGYVGGNPLTYTDPYGLRPLTAREKCLLSPYIPEVDLENADLRDGKVPWYLRKKKFDGITRGNKIFFRPGVYESDTVDGIALLGHELVHVGQYREGMNWLKYVWSTRKGYFNSKYEIPAYDIQAQIQREFTDEDIEDCESCGQ